MNNIDFIQLNKFSELHNGSSIFFCKTDYLLQEFDRIAGLNHDVVLISGNSDYAITDTLVHLAPPNIKKWFAQNAVSYNPRLEPIPIGLENKLPAQRTGHGVGYFDRVSEKEQILLSLQDNTIIPSKFIYANFNMSTNLIHREPIKLISQTLSYITWEEPQLDLHTFFRSVLNHKMVLCPAGNGIDTHRLWETLYCQRVPITIKIGNFKIYDLYKQYLEDQYNSIQHTNYNLNLLSIQYWYNLIRNSNN